MATSEIEDIRKQQGWRCEECYPYELRLYNQLKNKPLLNVDLEFTDHIEENIQKSLQLAKESQVMILGSAPEFYLKERMNAKPEGITFRYSERIYKRGTWRFLSPRGFLRTVSCYYPYRDRKLYMLCASAYTSADLRLSRCYKGKCYKWGYFPETRYYGIEELFKKKQNKRAALLWCGRFISWKHPELAILLAAILKKDGLDFIMNIIGSGEMEELLKSMVSEYQLHDYVNFRGTMSTEDVRAHMEEADIFLCTSDFQEGWGAVVNEAMNSGCALAASHAAGAVPYLIEDGRNGFVYQSGNLEELYKKVKLLIINRQLCRDFGKKAYETIITEWNATTAAERLLLLIEDLDLQGNSNRFQSGPCSKAQIIRNNWYPHNKSTLNFKPFISHLKIGDG